VTSLPVCAVQSKKTGFCILLTSVSSAATNQTA